MTTVTMRDRCKNLLLANGWRIDNEDSDAVYNVFYHPDGLLGFDVPKKENEYKEIVVISDHGDICRLPIDFYALLGYLLHHRQIAWNYKVVS